MRDAAARSTGRLSSVVASPASDPVGTTFQTFCTELQQTISSVETIGAIFTPTIQGTMNSSGNTLQNMSGIYLFDLWSNGLIDKTKDNAGAVQIAIWESEGYTSLQITGTGGITPAQLSAADGDMNNGLIHTLLYGTYTDWDPYSSTWAPTDVNAFILKVGTTGSQDQIVLVPTTPNTNEGSTPEPVSLVVWGVGAGLAAGATAIRRRRQPSRRWSNANRQAILEVVHCKH